MGFNNGYDSGYADAEAAFAAERTALQAEIRKLKAASGGTPASAATPGGSGSVPSALNIPPIRTLSPDITTPEVNIPGLLESNADIVLASDASSVSVLDGDNTGLNMSAITVTSELGNAVANLPVGAVLVAPRRATGL